MKWLLSLITCLTVISASAQHFYLFAGTYTTGKSKGIYIYDFNAQNGEVAYLGNTDSCTNPSFITLSPDGKFLYAVNETGRDRPGQVTAFSFDKENASLTYLNQQLSGGDDPCFITLDKSGKWLTVANYSGGSIAALPVNSDGSVAPYAQLIQHSGKSVNKQRQEKAHVHSTFFSPDFQYLLTPDLGMDKVMLYRFNPSAKRPLLAAKQPYVRTLAGSGPRHLSFHPNKKWMYLVEELSGTVSAYNYRNGQLVKIQTIATHPDTYRGQPGSADIHISPDGKFLYASNRGEENNLAIFSINPQTGKLTGTGYQPVLGEQPRNFIIDPTGNFLLVVNQRSSNMVVFKRNKENGSLEPTQQIIDVPNPVCLQMLAK